MNALEQQIQRLGELRAQRQRLEAQEQELASAVRGQMAEHGLQLVRSDDYEARLVAQEKLTVDAAALQRAVTKKEFLSCVSVGEQAARALLGDIRLRKMSVVTETVQLRVTTRSAEQSTAASAESRSATA
jgi:hypothetical protein